MPYWRLFYHLVWATRGREAILLGEVEATVHRVIRQLGVELGVDMLAIGNLPDHIHVVASIPPRHAVSDVMKLVKGRSSYAASHDGVGRRTPNFGWQSEYGVLSFGERALPKVVTYVESQRERHARNDTWRKLELIESEQADAPTNHSPERTSPS